MFRITAIGVGAVDYLLRGCDDPAHDHLTLVDRADSAELGADRYFAKAMEAGEPQGVWLGSGWSALGLDIQVGGLAAEDDVRAIFGQLRRPDSTERDPEYIGSKPRGFADYDERLAKLQAKEPDATPERLREMERQAASSRQRPVGYYDYTFSPAKSVSMLYAGYLAAGMHEEAEQVRAAQDEAVKVALAYAEAHVAQTRFGKTEQGREYVAAQGLAAVLFNHHTSREGEPQLHAHLGILNRVGTAASKIGALDGKAARPFKEAIGAAYDRALEQGMTDRLGVRFVLRPDGVAREVAGMDPDLLADGSTRRGRVVERVQAFVERYRAQHDREPDAAARKAMYQQAVFDTRPAKTGLAGPAAVAAWTQRVAGRTERLAAAVEQVDRAAMTAGPPVTASPERVARAMAAGLTDVQAKYATWQLGNLADAIDRHLGDADALGVTPSERPAALEALARTVIDPAAGYGVVQLNAHEAIEVPGGLRRGDGQPVWRPHEERRFATLEHLATERGVASFAARPGAQRADVELAAPTLERAGLSPDQDAAVRGILTSGRGMDLLVGPAGTGKSRSIGTLAQVWGEQVGGTVYGVATSQIATSNLDKDGLTALNATRFLDAVTPDPVTGRARRPLSPQDLIVVDEASMTATPQLAAVTIAAARAGAKVVSVGDPAQLDALGAGGLFAHLVQTLPPEQVHTLEQPHRFREAWEAEASLWLRDGDHRAVEAYTYGGRLLTGTVENMTAAARHGWLADRLDGLDAVLVVGCNQTAAAMSAELQAELAEFGRVRGPRVAQLADKNDARLGDVVEARSNGWNLRVDPSPDGVVEAVMNRGRYTIVGVEADGTILGRDRHGGIAHMPADYLAEHAALGYASTVHGAEGVSVDASHGVVDRDATREAVYVQATRGARHNFLYLVTEREPDEHEPQRITEVAAERLAAVLENTQAQRAAAAVLEMDEAERVSAPTLLARLDHAARAGAEPHLARIRERLGIELDPEDYTTARLEAAVRAVELAGHDPAVVLDRAIDARGFDDADSVAGALAHRLRGAVLAADQDPARGADPVDWTSRLGAHGDADLHGYTREVAGLVEARQADLGDRVAAEPPAWAATLGERPDPEADPAGEAGWRHRAGVTAFYREAAGLDPSQLSLGAPPTRERPVDRALYNAALAAAPHAEAPPQGRDWRAEPDAELYAARERWERDFAQAPEWVAEEMLATYRFARGYREDASIEWARAEAMPEGPARDQVAEEAERAARFAEQYEARAAKLKEAQRTRHAWWAESEPVRVDAAAAMTELDRRGLPPDRGVDEPTVTQEPDPGHEPEPAPEPRAFQREREAREHAAALRATEAAPEKAPEVQRGPAWSIDRSIDEEMLIDEEIRGRHTDLAREPGREHALDLDEGPELGW